MIFYVSGGTIQPALIAPRSENNSESGVDPAAQGSTILTIIDTTSLIPHQKKIHAVFHNTRRTRGDEPAEEV